MKTADEARLLEVAVSLPHTDDSGQYVWPYVKGRHETPCEFCDAIEEAIEQ